MLKDLRMLRDQVQANLVPLVDGMVVRTMRLSLKHYH
jgi:hypothetical protein